MKQYRWFNTPTFHASFPHAKVLENGGLHEVLCDPQFTATCGYASQDEFDVLYDLASTVGPNWLEIGAHTGWTTAALLGARGNTIVSLEPGFHDISMLARFTENIERVHQQRKEYQLPPGRVISSKIPSHEYLLKLEGIPKFNGIFVDGNHDDIWPTVDAILAEQRLAPDGLIVFHDFAGMPIQAAVRYLHVAKNHACEIFETNQLIAVCSPSAIPDCPHRGDPDVNWIARIRSLMAEGAANCHEKVDRIIERAVETAQSL